MNIATLLELNFGGYCYHPSLESKEYKICKQINFLKKMIGSEHMDIRILHSEHANIYQLIRLEALLNHPEAFGSSYEEEVKYPTEKFESRLEEEQSFTFGAFCEEKLVGIVTFVLERKNKLKHRANIYAMYTLPEYRGTGIGKSLMVSAINKARSIKGIERIYLSVVSTNEPAKKLYESLGFETYGFDKKALKVDNQYFDEEHMVLEVN